MSLNVIIPVLGAFSPWFVGSRSFPGGWPEWVQALAWGAVVALMAYALYRLIASAEDRPAEKAVLLGLLAAEVLVVHRVTSFPKWGLVTLYLFFYFNSMESSGGGGH